MNWVKLLYVLIIVVLYIPMVFLGANVFFSKYTGANSYYQGFSDCYGKYPYPPTPNDKDRIVMSDLQRKCQEEQVAQQRIWEDDKLAYEGIKYVFISLFNLLVLLVAVFWPRLQETVSMGLFISSIGATFGATLRYFDTRSKIGFMLLVVTFFLMVFFINQKKDVFVSKRKK